MDYNERSALVIIDIQVDFCSDGLLAVEGGEEIIPGINTLLERDQKDKNKLFYKTIATADWHPPGHISFASSHGLEPYSIKTINGSKTTLWPDHCIEETGGAEFFPTLNIGKADLLIRKGRSRNMDSYSAFFENDRKTPTGLAGYLENHRISNVYFCGLAFDWCVYFSAMDALTLGFSTFVLKDLTRSVNIPPGYADVKEKEMADEGVKIVKVNYL
ncbi:MAG: bifunctional nicotinamidase/pyrazinamidase [Spirochaetales bacterium]|nr:bifunctional nicotinamidase/pyrazinamidase [Spirochaetales bacterium]